MKIQIKFQNQFYQVDLSKPLPIAIPLIPNQTNVNCYYADSPTSEIIRAGDFVGSVAEGGSVNYNKLQMTPHGNGTHTECYGHISANKMTIRKSLSTFHFLACLISVVPKEMPNKDKIVTCSEVKEKLEQHLINKTENQELSAVILRTLPNPESKKMQQYSGQNPPYLAPEIGTFLHEKNISHLLVDLPSVDKENDGGALRMHKNFWNFPENPRKNTTITELIYVPNNIPDGTYLLNLQILNLQSDASPSYPVLYSLYSS